MRTAEQILTEFFPSVKGTMLKINFVDWSFLGYESVQNHKFLQALEEPAVSVFTVGMVEPSQCNNSEDHSINVWLNGHLRSHVMHLLFIIVVFNFI